MPRKKRTPPEPPAVEASPLDSAAGAAPLDDLFEEDAPEAPELELPDDRPDPAAMVAKFQIAVERRLDAMELSIANKHGDVLRRLAPVTDTVRRLERDVEQVRNVFSDLQAAAQKSTGEMVQMLKDAHAAAQQAKEAAQVYERMADARPDLLRRIEDVGAKLGQYRHEFKVWQSTVEQLAKRVSAGEQLDEDYQLTKHVVDDIGKRVHQINTNGVLASVRETKAAERENAR